MSGGEFKDSGGLKGCRAAFDLLQRRPELVYLDTAATAQKPAPVLQAGLGLSGCGGCGGGRRRSCAPAT